MQQHTLNTKTNNEQQQQKSLQKSERVTISGQLLHIYTLMLEHTGSRHWWPAQTDFEMIVGAILTQFVSWKNVVTAIDNLKREGILNIDGICSTAQESLEEMVRCTRFYKQKARKLKEFCEHVNRNYSGSLEPFLSKEMMPLRKELLSLYGIGEETADCILLYAAKKPIFVVDAYTRRVFHQLGYFDVEAPYQKMQTFFMEHLVPDVAMFNEFHAQIDGVGSLYCTTKNPDCQHCPVHEVCKKSGG